MPLNESVRPLRSNLTRAQKEQAEAAIFGLQEKPNPMPPTPTTPQGLSADDIERMRQILAAHDANNGPGIKQFDLNNPPVAPYIHQDYPKHLHSPKGKFLVVHSDEDRDAALEAGWSLKPVEAIVEAAPELSPEDAQEAAELDKIARQPRKK